MRNSIVMETEGNIRYLYVDFSKLAEYTHPIYRGGVCGVMVIVVGNGHADTSSNPEWCCLHFKLC